MDVVIVNWNTGHCLRDCLRSIVHTDRSRLTVERIVVVDNASTDDSLKALSTDGIPLDVLRNPRNRGFAAACNQGATRGRGELLLFLNPDTTLYHDTLRAVAAFLGTPTARSVGICGGRMLDGRGRPGISCSRFPTLRVFFGKTTGLDRLAPALFPPHHLRPAESGPVDQVIGAFFLLRRTLFERLGGFDERYFLYFEETDLALRARHRGLRSYYLHEARVTHLAGVSSAQLGGGRLRHSLCSRTRYVVRHWPRSHAWLLMALTLTVEPAARLARAALHRSASEARTVLAGYGGYLRWLAVETGSARSPSGRRRSA
ncbi:glycosyltransferase family 2 protein [Streptomyces sp. RG80]|uniref:glycosyltransferase family 2 protein n=1 Tax=Streptomyces sp. RG80 TaxID=3157340 RepID=UPI00338E4B0E